MRKAVVALPRCPHNPVCLGPGKPLVGVYETHLLSTFRKRWSVDEFLKLTWPGSGPLALGAEQLLSVQGKEGVCNHIIRIAVVLYTPLIVKHFAYRFENACWHSSYFRTIDILSKARKYEP